MSKSHLFCPSRQKPALSQCGDKGKDFFIHEMTRRDTKEREEGRENTGRFIRRLRRFTQRKYKKFYPKSKISSILFYRFCILFILSILFVFPFRVPSCFFVDKSLFPLRKSASSADWLLFSIASPYSCRYRMGGNQAIILSLRTSRQEPDRDRERHAFNARFRMEARNGSRQRPAR